MASVYGAGFAELYDLFHAGKQYAAEARFIRQRVDRILESEGRTLRLLDLACGTGSHDVAFSKLRFDVTGVDQSKDMLAYARRKAREAKRKIRFEQQDLAALDLGRDRFDVVTCLFDSLGYLRTDARIERALKRAKRFLNPGGVMVLEVWHAPAMLSGFDPLRVRRVRGRDLEGVRIGETRLLSAGNAAEVRYEVFFRKANAPWRHFIETHVNRFFTAKEVEHFVREAGLQVREVFGGYEENSQPSDDAWHLVIVAQH